MFHMAGQTTLIVPFTILGNSLIDFMAWLEVHTSALMLADSGLALGDALLTRQPCLQCVLISLRHKLDMLHTAAIRAHAL